MIQYQLTSIRVRQKPSFRFTYLQLSAASLIIEVWDALRLKEIISRRGEIDLPVLPALPFPANNRILIWIIVFFATLFWEP